MMKVIRVESQESNDNDSLLAWAKQFSLRKRLDSQLSTLITLLLLSACGFSPLYSSSYQASQLVDLASVAVEVSSDRTTEDFSKIESNVARRYSELFKAEINERTNSATASTPKRFTLSISLTEQQSSQFVNPDGTASRGALTYASHYKVTRLSDMKIIATGSIARTSSYNTAPNADYTSYVSLEDARKRAIMELAQAYKLRLAELVPTLADPNAGEKTTENTNKPVPVLQPAPSYETLRSRH